MQRGRSRILDGFLLVCFGLGFLGHLVSPRYGWLLGARARLFDLGFRKAILWVLEGNVRADRFYRRDQWAPDGAQRTDEVWGLKVNDVRYRRNLEAPERGF